MRGIRLLDGRRVEAGAVIVTTGHLPERPYPLRGKQVSCRAFGRAPSVMLGEALRRLGFEIGRLKTGTPPRLDARTIDFSKFQVQAGDPIPTPFSFRTKAITQPQTVCWIGYTNAETHRIIRENVHRAPLYSGQIKGIGPRYCPSIEDKIVKFPDKPQHQLFLEPEGMDTNEIYVNGMSTSMPIDVQVAMVKSIPGLENAEMIRPGLRHRIRHGAAHGALPVAREQEDPEPLPGRPDQRHDGLRGSRLPGNHGGNQRRAARAGQRRRDDRAHARLHGHPD